MRRRNLPQAFHSGRWARMRRERARLRPPKGYLLLELAITLMLVAVIGIYTRAVAQQEMDDGVAAATGTYVLAGAAGLETYLMANTTALRNGQAVAGVTTALQPTLAELQALTVNNTPMLPTTFPTLSPTRQALRFDIQLVGTELRATACLSAPLRWRGVYRDDLVAVAMRSMSGRGGRSVLADNGATIRGALITAGAGALPNPVGNSVGILCSVNLLSDAFYSSFARQTDTRNLAFSGTVSATGTVNAAAGTLVISTTTANAACTVQGAIAWVVSGTSHLPARCNGTNWIATGGSLPISTAGTACTPVGSLAKTAGEATLICQSVGQNAAYVDLISRMGSMVAMSSVIVNNEGGTVAQPSCVTGGTAAIYLSSVVDGTTSTSEASVSRSATKNGTVSWTISVLDGSSVPVPGYSLAMTYCIY